MRNGVLVGEDSPDTLISKQNVSTLEEAFLSFSCIQESENVSITILSYFYKIIIILWSDKSFIYRL